MFDMKGFDPQNFNPNSPFEGWLFAKIQNIEKELGDHLSKHNKLRIAYFVAGLGLISSLTISLICIILTYALNKGG